MTNPAQDERRSTFTSTTGGVMTEEAGAITGELELLLRPEADGFGAQVRYAGTDEWYTISGSPVRSRDDADGALARISRHLTTPGPTVAGNESAVTLVDPSGA